MTTSKAFILFFLFCGSHLYAQNTKVDVLIYGANGAGIMAAYSAKKMGKTVLLIEPSFHLGGLSAGGLGQTDIGNKQAITGLARDFYKRIGRQYGKEEAWIFEPHVAQNVFEQYLIEAKINVLYGKRVFNVQKKGLAITKVFFEDAESPNIFPKMWVKASQIIDCSYEGDIMAKAGVSYTVGREANSQYNETYNGVQLLTKHQFPDGIDPYKIPGQANSGLLWGISNEPLGKIGQGDKSVQAYNFRLCLTTDSTNFKAIEKPLNYNESQYELLARYIEKIKPKKLDWQLLHIQPMPNDKTDINNCGAFSTDMIGENFEYANASYLEREKIIQKHKDYTLGLLYFLGNNERVPEHLRSEMKRYGLPLDEYQDNGNFSPQIYVREARRMISDYVMTEAHCLGKVKAEKPIGQAAYTMDSHNCRRIVVNGMVKNEGDVQIGGFGPYDIDYRAIIPKATECTNLLVPVCLSASHIAYGSIRMEPVFMVLGQSAGLAAAEAIESGTTIQKIDLKNVQDILKNNPILDN